MDALEEHEAHPEAMERKAVAEGGGQLGKSDDTEHRGWKPRSMQAPVLGSLAGLSLLLALVIEVLAQRSRALGGLALAPSARQIPEYAVAAFRYVPNIVAAVYGLLWSWVDVDIRRMQPWLELSRESGASGRDSLFLDYSSHFLAFVPWTSATRRHWPVFTSSIIMILVLWILTPLQGTLFTSGIVPRNETINIGQRSRLLPLTADPLAAEGQMRNLDVQILHTSFGVAWLGQALPPFTTPEYALLPFYVQQDPAPDTSRAKRTATMTKLWTELDCSQVKAVRERGSNSYFLPISDSCQVTGNLSMPGSPGPPNHMFGLIPFDGLAEVQGIRSTPGCFRAPGSPGILIAMWAKSDPGDNSTDSRNMTALACRPRYYKQDVRATIQASSAKPDPDSLRPWSDRQLLDGADFNMTAFEYLVSSGQQDSYAMRDMTSTTHRPRISAVHNYKLSRWNIDTSYRFESMASMALSGQYLPFEAYQDPDALAAAFSRAYKLLFALGINRILINDTASPDRSDMAQSTYALHGILASRLFSAIVEGLFVLIALLSICLSCFCSRAPSHLLSNPNSISRLIDVFRNSPGMLDAFGNVDAVDDEKLALVFGDEIFRMPFAGTDEPQIERVLAGDDYEVGAQNRPEEQIRHFNPVRPLALTREFGMLFIAALATTVVILSWLKSRELRQNGLARPVTQREVRLLIEKYIPTVFATLLKPIWALINRLLCTIQPFRELLSGNGLPARSIGATYSAVPPALALWRAVKAHHFLLALVCLTALTGDLFGIGMAALFSERETTAKYPHSFVPVRAARIANQTRDWFSFPLGNDYEFLYAEANFSRETPLQPWVSPGYFFLPHRIVGDRPKDAYALQTRGFGADLNCRPVPSLSLPLVPDKKAPWTPVDANCSNFLPDPIAMAGAIIREYWYGAKNMLSGPLGFDSQHLLEEKHRKNHSAEIECQNKFALIWGRVSDQRDNDTTFDLSLAICRPIFETALFDVTVDSLGNILSYQNASAIESSMDFANSHAIIEHVQFLSVLRYWRYMGFYNTTEAKTWMSYLQLVLTRSDKFLDPRKPLPDAAERIPIVRDVFRRVFAITLDLLQETLFENATSAESTPVAGTRLAKETRIFVDAFAFKLSLTVLAFDIMVAILVYALGAVFVLPRLPTSIGSILAYVAPSSIVTKPIEHGTTLSFGQYTGADGSAHIGVEVDYLVVPIDSASLKAKKGV